MKKIIFFIRSYNDLDHFHPIIASSLKLKSRIFVLSCTSIDLSSDYRIQNLRTLGVHFFRIRLFNILMEQKIIGRILRKLTQFLSFPLGSLLKGAGVKLLCYEMSGPGGHGIGKLFFSPAKSVGIPLIAIPHGLNIYINSDMTTEIRKKLKDEGLHPNFSDRNLYDHYILQTEHHKETSIKWGQDGSKILVMGSPRFTKEGTLNNLSLQNQCYQNTIETPKEQIVLFLYPHWNYNVNIDEAVKFLEKLSLYPGIKVIVKPHTRNISKLDTYPENVISKFSLSYSDLPTPMLIECADLIINLGSSAGIDCIWLKKPLIYPKFLHSNTTVFDNYEISYNPENWEDMVLILKKLIAGKLTPKQDPAFIKDIIYGGDINSAPIDRYIELIQSLISNP